MKDNLLQIILSAVIIFLVGAMGFVFVSGMGKGVNVNLTSNPQNNADGGSPQVSNPQNSADGGSPQVSNPQNSATPDSGQSIGATQRPDIKITKYLDYDNITTGGVAITASTTGSFIIDNIYMETGANTMASGTLFQIYSLNNSFGSSTVLFSTNVMNFPKATAMNLDTAIGAGTLYSGYASSTQRIVLDDGASLYAKCTTASCKLSQLETEIGTAGQNMRITVILKPLDPGSSIYE